MRTCALVCGALIGCGSVGGHLADAPLGVDASHDAQVDASSIVAGTSCKAIHVASPGMPSGPYTIDPDGAGGDPPLAVNCDMTTDGGGWTIIFYPTSINLSFPVAYTSSTPQLLADAQSVLLAFRSAALDTYADYARFDLPAAWRTGTPFDPAGTDLVTGVSMNGGSLVTQTVRYGSSNFSSLCTDAWAPATMYGRICIENTTAPYYSAFAVASGDLCSNSSQAYSAVPCTAALEFSIAVR